MPRHTPAAKKITKAFKKIKSKTVKKGKKK